MSHLQGESRNIVQEAGGDPNTQTKRVDGAPQVLRSDEQYHLWSRNEIARVFNGFPQGKMAHWLPSKFPA
jgi:hypothetical protein